jgi:hypothetical protein
MINRKTNHRNEPCRKPGAVRRNLDIQYRKAVVILSQGAARKIATPGRSEQGAK